MAVRPAPLGLAGAIIAPPSKEPDAGTSGSSAGRPEAGDGTVSPAGMGSRDRKEGSHRDAGRRPAAGDAEATDAEAGDAEATVAAPAGADGTGAKDTDPVSVWMTGCSDAVTIGGSPMTP